MLWRQEGLQGQGRRQEVLTVPRVYLLPLVAWPRPYGANILNPDNLNQSYMTDNAKHFIPRLSFDEYTRIYNEVYLNPHTYSPSKQNARFRKAVEAAIAAKKGLTK